MPVQKTTDPRAIRTKNLIKDSFISLVRKKDFREVTVKDITEKAMINRATFYAHFDDKYELLECTVVQTFREDMKNRIGCHEELGTRTIRHILIVLCECLKKLHQMYRKSRDSIGPTIEQNIIQELQSALFYLLTQKYPGRDTDTDTKARWRVASKVLSWSIYGAAFTWNTRGDAMTPEQMADSVLPLLTHGLDSLEMTTAAH